MILMLTLPQLNPNMGSAVVQAFYPAEGSLLLPGTKLLDVKVDLSLAIAHDCPPVTYHRLALRDRAWLRRVLVAAGEEAAVGARLAVFSTEPDEDADAAPQRAARISIAGIQYQSDWWDEDR